MILISYAPDNLVGGFDPITDRVKIMVNGSGAVSIHRHRVNLLILPKAAYYAITSMVGSRKVYQNLTTDVNEPAAGTIGRWIQRSLSIQRA